MNHHKIFTSIAERANKAKKPIFKPLKEIEQKEMMVQFINQGEVNEIINEFIYQENIDRKNPKVYLPFLDSEMARTKYSAKNSTIDFFRKTHKFEEMKRKGHIKEETPSLAYISACKKEQLVPIATYLVKREGNENDMNLK